MSRSDVITRFAPSPTGALHFGGARTALFNWLFAKAHGGRFLLRIEDTDRVRSTAEAADTIISGLRWLGIDWDGEVISQHARRRRHRSAADVLVQSGSAYKCFATAEELAQHRENARKTNRRARFLSPWRDAEPSRHPDRPFCLRLKAPRSGATIVNDAVHGRVQWENSLLDDMIIIRTDGSPTYNFAVVVDDRDMGISHVIRGDDHLSNTARQLHVYAAFRWNAPVFAHVPLILDEDGKKLSKRTSAAGITACADAGYPPAAVRNYLARLGWSHGDDEFFTTEQAIEWFDLDGLRKSAARLDAKKLLNLSKQHLAAAESSALLDDLDTYRTSHGKKPLGTEIRGKALAAMEILKMRAASLTDLDTGLAFLEAERPLCIEDNARNALNNQGRLFLAGLIPELDSAVDWSRESLDAVIRSACETENVGFGRIAQPLRAALTGRTSSPGVVDVMLLLGQAESIGRIQDAASCSSAKT